MSMDPPAMWDSHPFFIVNPPPGTFTLSDKNLPTGPPIVYEKIQDMPREPYEDMLREYHDGISESCFETSYKEMFKRSLDYNSLGVKNIEELLVKMCDEEGKVLLVDKDPETNERHVKLHEEGSSSFFEVHDRPTEESSSDLYQEFQYLISGYGHGVSLRWLEERYEDEFGKSPNYGSVGLNDLKELIGKMKDKGTETKVTKVKCAWLVDILREYLKESVLKLLGVHDGEIPLSGFDCAYEDWFNLKVEYHQYGLKDAYHLCQVLNLGLEEADGGEMVIKARKKMDYNLRSNTRNGLKDKGYMKKKKKKKML